MRRPRDFSAETTIGGVRFARTFSNIVSPPVIFAILGLAIAWREVGLWPGLMWAAVFGFWVSLAPILFVVFLLKTRRITDLHMNTPRERRLPYLVGVAGGVIALVISEVGRGPEPLQCLALFSIVELSLLGLINTFWLISIHAASIAAAALLAALLFGLWPALVTGLLALMVAGARLFLRRHTVSQVLAGVGLGLASVMIVRFAGCFS